MAINPIVFYDQLASHGVDFFTGVPDSLLKEFCLCIDDKVSNKKHVIAANEGSAIALAAGYNLATMKVPLVYMQNSGFGNCVNPLLSLCDPEVYSIPMILLIGWRGEPGEKDEPQHVKQGKVQIKLLESMDIPYQIISKDEKRIEEKIRKIYKKTKNENRPVAILVKKNTFNTYKDDTTNAPIKSNQISREESLKIILGKLDDKAIIISTTGKTSREIFEIREKNNSKHNRDFLTVGSMGHCSSIALGVALANNNKVVCIDGDGALIMHMGILSTIAKIKPNNFYHILLNNFVHESVGSQKTGSEYIDIPKLVSSNNYNKIFSINSKAKLIEVFPQFINSDGPNFLEMNIKAGSRKELGRPSIKPVDNKKALQKFINQLI